MAKKLKTKLDDIRKLTDADLGKEVEEAYRRLFSMRLQRETRQLTNYQELPKMKRHIARLKTIQHQRELTRAGEGARS
jgi:ribosomal protein L29